MCFTREVERQYIATFYDSSVTIPDILPLFQRGIGHPFDQLGPSTRIVSVMTNDKGLNIFK